MAKEMVEIVVANGCGGELRDFALDEDTAALTKAARAASFSVAVPVASGSVADEEAAAAAAREASPLDGWLPITEWRGGSTASAVCHVLCSGMGIQALMLPVAFASLGWVCGSIILSLGFLWQLYTIWALVQLHESVPGVRYSRFLQIAMVGFGPGLGKLLGLFPVMYLSGGSCVMLIIYGGGALKLLFRTMCGVDGAACSVRPLDGVECFLVFACVSFVGAQLPNLHSRTLVSLIGAITAVAYSTLIWALSVAKGRADGVSYEPLIEEKVDEARIGTLLNAIGIIALSFRGHNLIVEIQGTLPSTPKCPSKRPMWRALIISYSLIAIYLYALAIAGFWAYGNGVPNGGLYIAFPQSHSHDTPKLLMGLIYLLVVINCLCSFQIYAMPVYDNLEFRYIGAKGRRCSRRVRTSLRVFFSCLTFFVSVTFPFLPNLGPLVGGMTSSLTFVLPCFMWLAIKRPHRGSGVWWLNVVLGCLGVVLWAVMVAGGIWILVDRHFHANFYHP